MNVADYSVYLTVIHDKLAIDITMILSTFFHDGVCNTNVGVGGGGLACCYMMRKWLSRAYGVSNLHTGLSGPLVPLKIKDLHRKHLENYQRI